MAWHGMAWHGMAWGGCGEGAMCVVLKHFGQQKQRCRAVAVARLLGHVRQVKGQAWQPQCRPHL